MQRNRQFKAFILQRIRQSLFAHNTACSDSEDLAKRTVSHEILKIEPIALNLKYDMYQGGLTSIIYKFL